MQLSQDEMSIIQQNVYYTIEEMYNDKYTSVLYTTLCKYRELIFDLKLLSDKVSSEIIERFNININIIENKYKGKTIKQIFEENLNFMKLLGKSIGRASDEELILATNKQLIAEYEDNRKFIRDNFSGPAYTDYILDGESDNTFWNVFIKKPEIAKLFEKYKLAF